MKSMFILGLCLSAISLCVSETKLEPLRAISESSNHFSSNLFKRIAIDKKENFVCSPLSAYVVLSMAAYGAGGDTAKQMRQTLHLPTDDGYARTGFQNLMDHLNKAENITLELANNIYVASGSKLKSNFKELASSSFLADATELDFAKSAEAAQTINDWSKEKTHEKIPNLVGPDDVTPDTRMVLLNAVYFKGNWAREFKKKDTIDRPFYLDEKNQKNVSTMFLKSKFVYGELPDLEAKFIELPYQNKDLKMVIIVPDKIDGLSKIEENIEKFNHTTLAENGYDREVFLYLPKFKVETTLNLDDPLKKMGMEDMFSNNANFTNLSEENIKVSKVVQKAFIEVNEEGSEAAAVTGMIFFGKSALFTEDEISLHVDRPFYYRIISKSTDTNLFEGACRNPL